MILGQAGAGVGSAFHAEQDLSMQRQMRHADTCGATTPGDTAVLTLGQLCPGLVSPVLGSWSHVPLPHSSTDEA